MGYCRTGRTGRTHLDGLLHERALVCDPTLIIGALLDELLPEFGLARVRLVERVSADNVEHV